MRSTAFTGIAIALFSVFFAILLEGASLASFFKISSMLLIAGGTFGATFASFSLAQTGRMILHLKDAMFSSRDIDLKDLFLKFSEKARKDGLLSLEDVLKNINDPMVEKGVRLIVDGSDPRVVEDVLYETAETLELEELTSAKVLETAAGFSPTIGIIGTVLGLVHVLENLDAGTKALGEGIATAFMATFYGIALANLILLPLAGKIKSWSSGQNLTRHAVIRGVISLQSGDNRRIMIERMTPYL